MTRPILADARAQAELDAEGIVTLPLVGESELSALRSLHEQLHPIPGEGFDTDFAYVAPEHKRAVDAGIRAVLGPALDAVLEPCRLFNVTFVTKWPGGESTLPIHQDWAYVDETVERSCTIWVPIDAVETSEGGADRDNGPLTVIPRSHLLPAYRRGANSRPWYLPYRDELLQLGARPVVRPGECLVFDSRILHGSGPNRTDRVRRALTVMVAAESTPLRYHHLVGGRWHVYEVGDDFFAENGPIDLRAGRPVGATLIEVADAEPPAAPLEELADRCGIELDPRPPVDDVAMDELAGFPLAVPEGAAVEPWLEDGAAPVVAPLAAASGALRAAWDDLGEPPATWEPSLVDVGGGTWTLRAVPRRPSVDGGGRTAGAGGSTVGTAEAAAAAVRDAVRDAVGDRDAYLVVAPPGGVLVPRRCEPGDGASTPALTIVPLRLDQPPGGMILQVGDRMVGLATGRPRAFDPSWEFRVMNFGATPVPLLVVVG